MNKPLLMRLLLLVAAAGALFLDAVAQGVPAAPNPPRLVNDRAGLFAPAQVRVLEDSLVAFDRATSTQIAVVTLPDLGNYAPSEMAFAIMDAWGVGQKDKNNGVVVLLKPRNEYGRGEVFIAVGLGLEGVLPDGKVGRVIDQEMMPYLKRGDYFGAVEAGCAALRAITRGEYTAVDDEGNLLVNGVLFLMVLVPVLLILFVVSRRRKRGGDDDEGNSDGGGGSDPLPWLIIGSLLGRGGRGGGGGGFGGFGGGGSFGGGAGRSF